LKTVKLVLNRINNITNNFLFFDTKIIKFEDLEENQRKNLEKGDYLPNIEIENSILNNMKFINCDFSEAEQIEIENSSLTKTEFVNVNWGEISEKRICPKLFKGLPEEVEKARDVYRQLKLALDNQKDHINANEFYSLEMKAYERVLREKPWKTHFQKKLVFSIHKFVSNFGQSWIRPLILIILLTTGMIGLKENGTLFSFLFWLSILFPILFLALLEVTFRLLKWLSRWLPQWLKRLLERLFKKIGLTDLDILKLLKEQKELNFDYYAWMLASIFALAGLIAYTATNPKGISIITPSLPLFLQDFLTSFFTFLDNLSQILNIFGLFKNGNTESLQFPSGYKFFSTLYSIAIAFLTYQMIVAIRRQVRR
jgi:hypothetical protein